MRVANKNVVVSGRLVTIEGVKFSSDPELFPRITAEIKATVYLSPKAQGTTAGATPQGPAGAPGPHDSGEPRRRPPQPCPDRYRDPLGDHHEDLPSRPLA